MISFVPGKARRATSLMASAGVGDNPASNRTTSAGTVATAFKVCGRVSVWATTARSFSKAKILLMPTRKIASESARMIRIGNGPASVDEGEEDADGEAS